MPPCASFALRLRIRPWRVTRSSTNNARIGRIGSYWTRAGDDSDEVREPLVSGEEGGLLRWSPRRIRHRSTVRRRDGEPARACQRKAIPAARERPGQSVGAGAAKIEIGRASCRERVEISAVAVSLK